MARGKRLPNVGEDDQNAEEDGRGSTTKDVGNRNDQDIGKPKGDHVEAGK